MNLGTEIKKLAIERAKTLKYLAEQIAKQKGKRFSPQNFSNKLKNGTVTIKELAIILDTLGYTIEFKEKL